jgi:multidrug efflux pump
MKEVSGPIIAIALVLCAVFVPIAFVSGLTGQFYRQFALTIAISTVISAFQFADAGAGPGGRAAANRTMRRRTADARMDKPFGRFFAGFNRFFGRASHATKAA